MHKWHLILFLHTLYVIFYEALSNRYGFIGNDWWNFCCLLLFLRALFVVSGEALRNRYCRNKA
jgi:hypothetical protein